MEQPIKEKRLKRDIAAHIGIGQWIALCINNPKYRWGGILLGVFWLAYEIMEAWRKGDEAYNEIREAIIGICSVLAFLRIWNWLSTTPKTKQGDINVHSTRTKKPH